MRKSLLDLMGDGTASSQPSAAVQQSARDLLADIFGSDPPAENTHTTQKSAVSDIMGLFGTEANAPSRPQPSVADAPIQSAPERLFTAFEGHGLKITLAPTKDSKNPNVTNFLLTFHATEDGGVQSINFQAAVPKVRAL